MADQEFPQRLDPTLGALGVCELLREQIRSGRYPKGRLPDETALSRDLGVSRTRLRAAIGMLRDEGLIDRRRGLGTFVNAGPLEYEVGERHGFRGSLASRSLDAVHELVSATTWAMDPLTAELFGVHPGVPMHVVERLTRVEGVPLAHASYVIRGDLGPGMLDRELIDAGLDMRDWLGLACRRRLESMSVSVEAVAADESLAPLLGCAEGAPLVRLHRRFQTEDDELFAFGSSICRGDRFAFTSNVQLHDEHVGDDQTSTPTHHERPYP